MRSFSAIVVLVAALCLAHAVHSRGLNTGGLCSEEEFQCDASKCIKKVQICDNTTDCTDGSDESGCDCLLKGSISCEVKGKCIDKEQFCNGFSCPNMKGNATCSNDLQGSNSTMNTTTKENNMTISVNKFNMTMDDKNTNMTMENKNTNMTMKNNNTNMTMEGKNTKVTMEDKNINMTMGDKNSNMTTADKNSNMTMENENSNMTSDDKISEMTIDDKNTNLTLEKKAANMTNENSRNFNTIVNEPKESKKNISLNNTMMASKAANESMMEIDFDYGNSTDNSWNVTEVDSTPRPEESIDVTMENSGFTMEGDVMEKETYSNETEVCNMSYSIVCEEFDPPCILAVAYCNDSIPCPSQIRSDVCGEDGLPFPKRKAKLSNLVDLQEPEEKNFINSTQELGSDEHATKESLKVAESEKESDKHLKIIIPVVVIGGLCLVVIIVWFITRRNKNVDSYALQ